MNALTITLYTCKASKYSVVLTFVSASFVIATISSTAL